MLQIFNRIPAWQRLILLTFLFTFGFNIYGGVFQNYLRDVFHSKPSGLGELESMREIPGLLAALTTGLLLAHAEARIAAIGLIIGGVGIACTGVSQTYNQLVAITVFWSIGFHLYVSVSNAITLQVVKGQDGGHNLGKMGSVGAIATVCSLGLAWGVSKLMPHFPYNAGYILGGSLIVVAGVICFTLGHGTVKQENPVRIVLRKEYGLFYLLTFLEGCRRQIFSIFASFVLILVYKVPVENMLLLQLVNSILIAITAPKIGRLVDRIGEKGPLTFYAIGLIVVFLGYAVTKSVTSLYALFLIDNILFSFSVGFTTYLHRIVRPGEMTPCLTMGVTMNHIAAVTVPIGGSLLWEHTNNYQLPFWVGTAIAGVSLIATRFLPSGPRLSPTPA